MVTLCACSRPNPAKDLPLCFRSPSTEERKQHLVALAPLGIGVAFVSPTLEMM